ARRRRRDLARQRDRLDRGAHAERVPEGQGAAHPIYSDALTRATTFQIAYLTPAGAPLFPVGTGVLSLVSPLHVPAHVWRAAAPGYGEDVDLELAARGVARGELCSPVRLEVPGLGIGYGVVLFTGMDAPDGRYEPLLGYLALEELRVAVDLVQHRLV